MYSNTDQSRHEHNGIVKWLDEVLAGILEENYKGQVNEQLGSSEPSEPETPGTDWMETDGLATEED